MLARPNWPNSATIHSHPKDPSLMNTVTPTPAEVITSLVEKIARVGQRHTAMLAAFGEERAAQATAISALVELIRPVLPALVSPTTIDTTSTWGISDQRKHVQATVYQLGRAPTYRGPGNPPRLFVDVTGTLFWTHPEKQTLEQTTAEIISDAAIWPVEKWVANVWADLENVLAGNAGKNTVKAEDRAARLKAIAVLLDVNNRFNVPEKKEGVDHRPTT